jgi:hypothetical protein
MESLGLVGQSDVWFHLAWDGLANYTFTDYISKELPIHYVFLKAIIACGLKDIIVWTGLQEICKCGGEAIFKRTKELVCFDILEFISGVI